MSIGVSIVRDQLTVGQSATARCISDLATTSMEWETRGAVLARSATSVQQLDLVFTLVNDSIHDQIYTCQVTREDRVRATQNFTAKIDGNSVQRESFNYFYQWRVARVWQSVAAWCHTNCLIMSFLHS